MSEELDLSSILSQDNPDGDVFGGEPEPVQPEPAQPATEQQEQEQPEQTQPAAVTDANPYPDGSPQHNAFKQQREDMQARFEAEREAAVLRAIAERDAQWQQATRQEQQTQADPYIDPLDDPEGHAAWVQRQITAEVAKVKQEFDQREQQRQQAEYQRETQRLIGEAGAPVETLQAALAHVQQSQPWMIAGLNQAPNPYKAVLDFAKTIGFDAPATTPQKTSNDAIPDHIRQQVLAEEARKRAAAGIPPQTQMPRGVGSVPSGAGFNDSLPPPSEYSKLSAADYEAVKAKILSQ